MINKIQVMFLSCTYGAVYAGVVESQNIPLKDQEAIVRDLQAQLQSTQELCQELFALYNARKKEIDALEATIYAKDFVIKELKKELQEILAD